MVEQRQIDTGENHMSPLRRHRHRQHLFDQRRQWTFTGLTAIIVLTADENGWLIPSQLIHEFHSSPDDKKERR